jgi:DNA-binding LacI/PurR family transcriptional regulator
MAIRRVSIKDVAREAGVSVTTVSHALNDKGRLSADTRRHVHEVAERMGYRPNPAARSLVSGSTRLIAAMASLPDVPQAEFSTFGYYTALIGAASGAAVARDHALVIAPPSDGGFIWERVPLDGVLVIDPMVGERALPALRALGIPYVTIGEDPDGGGGPCVTAEDAVATEALLAHLVERGATAIGLFSIPPINAFARTTAEMFGAWCARTGHVDRRVMLDLGEIARDEDRHLDAALDEILAAGVDAIYAPIEIVGVDVLHRLTARGIAVPRDLMLATTADAGLAAQADPPLTTISYDYPEMGRQAAELLLDLIAGERSGTSVVSVPATVTQRASTGR